MVDLMDKKVDSDQDLLEEMETYLSDCEDASEIWEGRAMKSAIRKSYTRWLVNFANWRIMGTLTFKDDYVSVERAKRVFRALVRELNKGIFGKHYTRYVGHSYFSYVLATEYQSRGVPHFHFLADRPLDFGLLHKYWNERAGFAYTYKIQNLGGAVRYTVKYIVKDGDIEAWKQEKRIVPVVVPNWWREKNEAEDGED